MDGSRKGSGLRAQGSGLFTGITLSSLILLSACGAPPPQQQAAAPAPAPAPPPPASYHVYVTNETGGELTIINGDTNEVAGTIAVGKRPRGIRVSPDGTQLFVALSGSPIGGPGVDESKLPPADKAADGIGIVDIALAKPERQKQRLGAPAFEPERLHGGPDRPRGGGIA